MSESNRITNPRLLAVALMLAGMTSGCEPLENLVRAVNPDDPVTKMRGQAFIGESSTDVTVDYDDIPPEVVQPEPVVYTPPEPKPLGCEPLAYWRHEIKDCEGRHMGWYGMD